MATDTLDYHASLPYLNQVQKINYESEVRSIADDTSITTYVGLVNKVRELGQTLGFKTLPNIGSCGSAFHVIQPWALVASPTVSGKAPTVTIAEASIAAFNVMDFSIFLDEGGFNRFFQTSVPNGVSSYKGYVVESINGKAPLDLAKDIFAGDKVIGPSSAFSSAVFFNRTLSIQNGFLSQWDRPYMSTFFQKDVSYKLRNPTTNAVVELTVPWLVAPDDDYFVSENFSIVFNAVLPRCFAISSSSVAMGSDVEPISTHPIDVLTHVPPVVSRRPYSCASFIQTSIGVSAKCIVTCCNAKPSGEQREAFVAYLVDSTTMAIMLSTENPYPIDAESDSGSLRVIRQRTLQRLRRMSGG
ncbi:hypothetical protein BC829DRAFT_265333 [Chytridium lagenaria]|nr:hypothetical protein BC829DRAFT_265333 [Chytridium lagenaria]